MSNYGNPPQDPYGQQPASADPYGQQPGLGQPAYGTPSNYASWGKRVGALLVDGLLGALAALPLIIGYVMLIVSLDPVTDPETGVVTTNGDPSGLAVVLILLGLLVSVSFAIWNLLIKQGRTGYSIGKGLLGIKLIREETGQPVGVGLAFVRAIAHFLDSLPCGIGYLWPLWDAKRQTFADKVMGTVVIDQPKS
ncbi:RDD family protein [Nocardioides sp. InS609-2]|uniref:RDD family protein n=1 Tax=Nocardioides sp. InS609-2 TaxID=2760705 RepID=UPI0020BDDB5A|nr:RDD family protein [Nocardioides sp. InS609-2]